MKATSRRAFTLIELLVVIAIIGILSAVVLASLGTARTRAKDTAMVAQIKQVKNALEMFYAEHGFYPVARNSSGLVTDGLAGTLGLSFSANTDSPSAATFMVIPSTISNNGYLRSSTGGTGQIYGILLQFEDTSRPNTSSSGQCKTGSEGLNIASWGTGIPFCTGV